MKTISTCSTACEAKEDVRSAPINKKPVKRYFGFTHILQEGNNGEVSLPVLAWSQETASKPQAATAP